jgi:hypothetical protein
LVANENFNLIFLNSISKKNYQQVFNKNISIKIIVNPVLNDPHGNPVVVLPGRRSLLEASGSSGMESGWESLVVFKSRGHAQF